MEFEWQGLNIESEPKSHVSNTSSAEKESSGPLESQILSDESQENFPAPVMPEPVVPIPQW